MKTIDLNCDLGEFEHWIERDVRLCEFVSSINVACGGHAGTPETMRRLCESGHRLGIRVGAHPSYPDRAGFGRVPMPMEHDALREEMTRQAGQLAAAANAAGVRITHVKPHGALYNQAARDPAVASAIVDAIRAHDSGLIVYGLSGSVLCALAQQAGLAVAHATSFPETSRERCSTPMPPASRLGCWPRQAKLGPARAATPMFFAGRSVFILMRRLRNSQSFV